MADECNLSLLTSLVIREPAYALGELRSSDQFGFYKKIQQFTDLPKNCSYTKYVLTYFLHFTHTYSYVMYASLFFLKLIRSLQKTRCQTGIHNRTNIQYFGAALVYFISTLRKK